MARLFLVLMLAVGLVLAGCDAPNSHTEKAAKDGRSAHEKGPLPNCRRAGQHLWSRSERECVRTSVFAEVALVELLAVQRPSQRGFDRPRSLSVC